MRNIGYVLLPAMVIGSFSSRAQDITEAYNFSNLTVQGTARSMGFGNALGSVGGDFSSLSVNPAGLGVYRSSEIEITPSLRINSTSSDYAGSNTPNNITHFNINNFGLVFTNAPKGKRYEHRSWKTVSFAFGMNRVADFNQNYSYQGVNNSSSASQAFESDANQFPGNTSSVNGSLGSLGYNSYLLNKNAGGQYYTIVPFIGGINQMKSAQTTGGIDEYTFSLGGNYKEKLMLGITIGVPSVRYERNSYYAESLAPGNNADNPFGFNSFDYSQTLRLTGSGINAKIGAIYKFSDIFRLGVAFHSPTYYSISDTYDPGISTTHNDSIYTFSSGYGDFPGNQFDYHLSTPWKGIISATVMINKLGFITADFEYVDYASMRYRYPGGIDNATGATYLQEADAMNQEIKKTYQGTSNFRLGGEARIGKFFMVRAGFGYYGNAYTSYGQTVAAAGYTTQRIDLNGGLGFRFEHFFADLGFVHSMYEGYEQPYTIDYSNGSVVTGAPASIPIAKTSYSVNNLAMTLGLKF